MARNISFALTTDQFRKQTKTVTRRLGWLKLKAGDELMGCVKCMGLKPGEEIERLGLIRVVDVRRERLDRMYYESAYGKVEALREGFPEMTGFAFVKMFCDSMGCVPAVLVTRIEFEYVEKLVSD